MRKIALFGSIFFLTIVVFTISAPAVAVDKEFANAQTVLLNQIGYATGAAGACNVARKQSVELASGMAIAINTGAYGDAFTAYSTFHNAQQGASAAVVGQTLDCTKIEILINKYTKALLSVKASNIPQRGLPDASELVSRNK